MLAADLARQGPGRPGVAGTGDRRRRGTGTAPGQLTCGTSGALTAGAGGCHRAAPGDQRTGQGPPRYRTRPR